jgi:hypothetical protein
MDIRTFDHLGEGELETALMEIRRELERGEDFTDTFAAHIRRITAALKEEGDAKWPKIQE